MTSIPFMDFSGQYQEIKHEIDPGLRAVFEKGNFILGEEEKSFEAGFARYCDVRFGVGVNSGTDALYLALAALDIGPGDEVILPTHTFIATALCVSYTGAKPVFADIETTTYNLDPESLKKAVTSRTRAVIPVHIYGQAANMDEINAIAREQGFKVIEDACQAHGARYKDRKIGSLGDIGCFSFYPTKSLGAFGDGGMIVTDDEKIYEKCLMLRDYGRQGRYEHKIKGYNSRLDTVQAVILAAKLKRLDGWNELRRARARRYCEGLADLPGVTVPVTGEQRTHVYQTFAVRVSERDRVLEALKEKGVSALIHYPIPLHLQEAYADMGHKRGDFPQAEAVTDEILSLPMFPHISEEQVDRVCAALKDVL